uniref:Uncharacterized protein n=1 Tax=Macrostomum lignano TaxID=282301 RepID=A0A1I8H6D9_9PLAT
MRSRRQPVATERQPRRAPSWPSSARRRAKKIPETSAPCSLATWPRRRRSATCCCCSGLTGPSSPSGSARLLQRMPTW